MELDESNTVVQCPDCSSADVFRMVEFQRIEHTELGYVDCQVPVHTCRSCRAKWTDWEGEEARERAIQKKRASIAGGSLVGKIEAD